MKLCKKSFPRYGFKKDEYYKTKGIVKYENEKAIIIMNNHEFKGYHDFMFKSYLEQMKYTNTTNFTYWKDRVFEDYFYTEREIRKLKLNTINKKESR